MEGMSMFVKLQERTIGKECLVNPLTKDVFKQDKTLNTAQLSETAISVINTTLNRLFKQGLLQKFHSEEMKRIVILTKNLSREIRYCIKYENYLYDIQVLHLNELKQDDLKLDLIIAFDFHYETIFFNEVSEKTERCKVPIIRFEIEDQRIYMGPIFFTQKPFKIDDES